MPRRPDGPLVAALVALGLTPLEAEVYTRLVRGSPTTGYRVAQQLGRATANVYKALESLAAKGAVLVDSGRLRRCRAVAPGEFVGRRARELDAAAAAAVEALEKPVDSPADDGVYDLRTREQAEERFATMLSEARDVVLIDASPEPLALARDQLASAAARGVTVAVKAYAALSITRATIHVDPRAGGIRRRWGIEWLHAVVDGSQTLLAGLDGGEVRHALWTRNAYLNVVYHEALASEIILAGLSSSIARGASPEPLRRALRRDLRLVRLDERGFSRLHAAEGAED